MHTIIILPGQPVVLLLYFPPQDNQLYYDPENGTYYRYNYDTRQYETHSYTDQPESQDDSPDSESAAVISRKAFLSLEDRVIEPDSKMLKELLTMEGTYMYTVQWNL